MSPVPATLRTRLAAGNRNNTLYEPIRDFTPITSTGEAVLVVAANPNAPFGTIKEILQYVRKNPGKLSYASSGVGTNHHLSARILRRAADDIDMVHVPYKTAPQLMIDTISGQLSVAFTILATISNNVKAGKPRVLAVYNPRRYHLIPEVPTLREEAPGYQPPPGCMGYLGPANLPQAMVTRLNTEMAKFYSEPLMQSRADVRASCSPATRRRSKKIEARPGAGPTRGRPPRRLARNPESWSAIDSNQAFQAAMISGVGFSNPK